MSFIYTNITITLINSDIYLQIIYKTNLLYGKCHFGSNLLMFMSEIHKDEYCVYHPASLQKNLRDFENHWVWINQSWSDWSSNKQMREKEPRSILIYLRLWAVSWRWDGHLWLLGFWTWRRKLCDLRGTRLMRSYFMQTNHFLMYFSI